VVRSHGDDDLAAENGPTLEAAVAGLGSSIRRSNPAGTSETTTVTRSTLPLVAHHMHVVALVNKA
jgi:hypothetical protein